MMFLARNEPRKLTEASREWLVTDQILGFQSGKACQSLPHTGESLSPQLPASAGDHDESIV